MKIELYTDQLKELHSLINASQDRNFNILIKGEKGIGKSLKQQLPVDFEILKIESIYIQKKIQDDIRLKPCIILENLHFLTSGYNNDPIAIKNIIGIIKSLKGFIIGTTIVDLPADLVEFFHFEIDFPLPSPTQRSELILENLLENKLHVELEDLQDLIDKSVGLSTGQIIESFKILNQKHLTYPTENDQEQDKRKHILYLKIILEKYYRPLTKHLVKLPNVSIQGVEKNIIKRLENLLIGFSKKFKNFNNIGVNVPGGILLHGPVGVGKTRLAMHILKKLDLNVLFAKPSQIFSKYLSESESNIVDLFKKASECTPCVIFLDEIDVYGCKRDFDNKGSNVNARILSTLLNEMDGIGIKRDILVLGTCSDIKRCDDALLRPGRLDVLIRIDDISS